MALIITLLCNHLIISIPRNENLWGFYLHNTHSKSVVGFLSRAADTYLGVCMAKDKDWSFLDQGMTFLSQQQFLMLGENKVTWILQGKQHNICPLIFSVLIFPVSNHLVCAEFKSITEVIITAVPFLTFSNIWFFNQRTELMRAWEFIANSL